MSFSKRASAVDVFLKRLKQNGHQYLEGFSREEKLKRHKINSHAITKGEWRQISDSHGFRNFHVLLATKQSLA